MPSETEESLEYQVNYYKNENKRLRKTLERINDSIVRTGPNSIGTSINLFELKGIVETALQEVTEI